MVTFEAAQREAHVGESTADPGGRSVPTSPPKHRELLFDLFGDGVHPVVCGLITPGPDRGFAAFCRELALELAASQGPSDAGVVLLDGEMLLQGRAPQDLQPLRTALGGISGVWSWPEMAWAGGSSPTGPLAVQRILRGLRSRFDYLLIACPPANTSGLAAALAAVTDKTVLLIRQKQVRRGDIQAAQRALAARGAPVVGCAFYGEAQDQPVEEKEQL